MNDMEDIRITECENRHLYPSNLYKTCPYCKKGAEEIAKREAVKKAEEPEFHINTKSENSRLRFCKYTEVFKAILSVLFAPIVIMFKIIDLFPGKYEARYDSHYWDKYGSYWERHVK